MERENGTVAEVGVLELKDEEGGGFTNPFDKGEVRCHTWTVCHLHLSVSSIFGFLITNMTNNSVADPITKNNPVDKINPPKELDAVFQACLV